MRVRLPSWAPKTLVEIISETQYYFCSTNNKFGSVMPRLWTPQEDKILFNTVKTFPINAQGQIIATTAQIYKKLNGTLDRSINAVRDRLKRICNAVHGNIWSADCDKDAHTNADWIARLTVITNERRIVAHQNNLTLIGPLQLTKVNILTGNQKEKRKTDNTKSELKHDNLICLTFKTNTVKQERRERRERIKEIKAQHTEHCIARGIPPLSENTIPRYLGGGKGYENGPPAKFAKSCADFKIDYSDVIKV